MDTDSQDLQVFHASYLDLPLQLFFGVHQPAFVTKRAYLGQLVPTGVLGCCDLGPALTCCFLLFFVLVEVAGRPMTNAVSSRLCLGWTWGSI